MPYLDIDDQPVTPAMEEENRRKMLGMLAASRNIQPLQPRPSPAPPNLAQPEAPSMNAPAPTGLQPTPMRPARPNVRPQLSDFQPKPELSGWKKVLGLGAGFALGSAPLVHQTLYGQRDKAAAQFKEATSEYDQSQSDETRALQNKNIQSEIDARDKDKPTKEATPDTQTFDFLLKQGKTPAEALEIIKGSGKADKTPNFEEQEYGEWAAAQKAAGKPSDRLTFEGVRAQRTQKPERPQRTLITVPQADGSSRVVEATPGMTIPKGAKTVPQLGKESEPTADEQRRADLGKNLNENLAAYEDIVKRRPDLFGPLAGRKTALLMMTGSSDPDISALRGIKEFAGMAAVGTHAMRNAQHVKIASDAMMNLYDEPEAILAEKGPLNRARTSIQTFIGDVSGDRVQDKHPGKDFGDAGGKPEGATGKLPDGTPVIVKNGRIVAQK